MMKINKENVALVRDMIEHINRVIYLSVELEDYPNAVHTALIDVVKAYEQAVLVFDNTP